MEFRAQDQPTDKTGELINIGHNYIYKTKCSYCNGWNGCGYAR